MANINLITYSGSLVTPQCDALMNDAELNNNGMFFGGEVSPAAGNTDTLQINHGFGVIYGREFEILAQSITVQLATSGTLFGRVYIELDLNNQTTPIALKVYEGTSLPELVDNPNINQASGLTQMEIATFTVDTSTVSNVINTVSQVTRVADGLRATNASVTAVNNYIDTSVKPVVKHNVTYAVTGEGDGIYLQGGGTTIIGAGEAAQKIIDNDINNAKAGNSESVHIAADNTVFLYSNCQSDISQRKGAVLTSAGNFNVLNGGINATGAIKSDGKTCFPITSRDVDINLHTASWSAATALYYTEVAVSGWQSIIGVSVEYWGALAGFVQPYIVNNGKIGLMSTVGSFPRTDATITVRIIGTRTSGD